MRGQWLLLYVLQEYGGLFSSPDYDHRVPLDATNEDEAFAEGQRLWQERIARGRQKISIITYPHSPRVVYEIKLED
jgi:hypothetical protein